MKLGKELLNTYNNKDTVLVVSSYPRQGETYSKGVCAVASFTKNTLQSIRQQNPGKRIVILTMKLEKEEIYEEGKDMLIIRCFSRNNPLTYLNLLFYTRKFNHAKSILVGFEFATFGDTITTGLLSIFIWTLYFMRKGITLVVHQVIFDISKLSGHIGISASNPLIRILNSFLKLYYRFISLPVKSIVVLEDNLKKRLSFFVDPNKIYVIPHGVHTSLQDPLLNRYSSRKHLNIAQDEFVVMYFGYMTWYKGVDFLIQAFKNNTFINGKKVRLLLAGGPSFTQAKKKHYQDFYQKISQTAKEAKNITLTGFVAEEKIPLYFEASDLVVFPYRTFMSSSGSLATALSFEKPILLSKNLGQLLETNDIASCLDQTQINMEDLLFDLTEESLITAVTKVMNPGNYEKVKKLSIFIKEKRSFENLSANYADLLFPQPVEKPIIALALDKI